MTAIHRDASRFINLVAHLADHHYHSRSSVLQELPVQSTSSYMDLLPIDLQISFYNRFVILNYSDWLRCSAVLEPTRLESDKESLRQKLISETARYQLAKLQQPLDSSMQPHEQLLKHIFQEAFFPDYTLRSPFPSAAELAARDAQLEELFLLTSRFAPDSGEISTLLADRSKSQASRLAFALFNSLIGNLICLFVTYKIIRYVQVKIGQTALPLATSSLRTHAPSMFILAERAGIAARYIIVHFLNPIFHLLVKTKMAAKQYILLDFFIEPLEYIGIGLRFCAKGVFKPAFWVVVASGRIGYLLHHAILYLRYKHQQQYWQRGTDIARRIWIDLTTKSAQATILQR
ncbi:MAG: hypothetical protein JSS10_08220 [Verrucomicrobia bacterium]|nr:hypothetical protein [Verrucomicrobiota bacterium]